MNTDTNATSPAQDARELIKKLQEEFAVFRDYSPLAIGIDRQLLAISFNPQGNVSNVERFTLEDGRVVVLSRRVTETSVQGVGFIRQLLGNVGRLRADQFLDNN